MSFTIDVHHHILPDVFWRATNDAHNPVGGISPAPWSKESTLSYMDDAGINVAITSISTPGVHMGDDAAAYDLSRRVNEKIVLPGIDTTIQLLSTKQGLVRLGIDAPAEVAIFREEVWDRRQTPLPPKKLLDDSFARARLHELNHLLRNRLNAANLGLAVLRQQTLRGLTADADKTLLKLDEDFRTFRE